MVVRHRHKQSDIDLLQRFKQVDLLLRQVRADAGLLFDAVLDSELLCSHTEQGHVQHIGFTGIHHGNLLCGKLRRDQVLLDSICMDAVIDLGQISLDVPAKLFHFLGLEPLKFLDQIQLEFNRNPGGKLKGDLFVCISATVSTSF